MNGALVLLAVACVACTSRVPTSATPAPLAHAAAPHAQPSGPALADVVNADAAVAYLNAVLPALAGRTLSEDERARIRTERGAAITSILEAAVLEPAFARSARGLIEKKLFVSGAREGVDFGLPGNLAEHIARNELAWANILTAGECYDANDQVIACDTGAPYTAGVLTTRGYLISRAGRFNLTRSSTLMRAFACTGYPMDELEPKIAKDKLIPMFRAENPGEQTDPRAAGGFGNGEGCYFCHGQFSKHAQLYVKFDVNGIYHPDATGIQDPTGELGRSVDGLLASHMFDPTDSASEHSEMFGTPVDNLASAMQVFTQNPVFLQCAARNVMEHALLADPSVKVDPLLLQRIATAAKARHAEPSLQDIVVAALTDVTVVQSALTTLVPVVGEAP